MKIGFERFYRVLGWKYNRGPNNIKLLWLSLFSMDICISARESQSYRIRKIWGWNTWHNFYFGWTIPSSLKETAHLLFKPGLNVGSSFRSLLDFERQFLYAYCLYTPDSSKKRFSQIRIMDHVNWSPILMPLLNIMRSKHLREVQGKPLYLIMTYLHREGRKELNDGISPKQRLLIIEICLIYLTEGRRI